MVESSQDRALNIKNAEAYRLAQRIASITGEKLTQVVIEALRERYERLNASRTKPSIEELRAIAARAAAGVNHPYVDHAEFLYDERGLPK